MFEFPKHTINGLQALAFKIILGSNQEEHRQTIIASKLYIKRKIEILSLSNTNSSIYYNHDIRAYFTWRSKNSTLKAFNKSVFRTIQLLYIEGLQLPRPGHLRLNVLC